MNDPQEYATSLLSSSWPLGWWGASRDVQETQSWKDSASPIVHQCPYFNPLILPSNLQPKPTYFINLFIGECWSDLYPVGLVLTLWDFCPPGGSGQNVVTVLPSPKGGFWHQWSFTLHRHRRPSLAWSWEWSHGQMPLLVKPGLVLGTGFSSFRGQQFCVSAALDAVEGREQWWVPNQGSCTTALQQTKPTYPCLKLCSRSNALCRPLFAQLLCLEKSHTVLSCPAQFASTASYLATRLLVYICYNSLDCTYTQHLFDY